MQTDSLTGSIQSQATPQGELQFTPRDIHQIAHARLPVPFWKLFWKQAQSELGLLIIKNVNFRKRANDLAREAYRAMSLDEFEGINARQRWANWRTIPKNLNGRLPNRPLKAIDLCCGVGHSTEVLATYLPWGSEILGLEYNPDFVIQARRRIYRHLSGQPAQVRFNTQSVLDSFHDDEGRRVEDQSIDLINSCGAVGNHFTPEATAQLAREAHRVLRRGGLATIDSGTAGTSLQLVTKIFQDAGFEPIHQTKSVWADPHTQICFRSVPLR